MEWGRKGAVTYLPRLRTQLVAARTVAEQVARIAAEGDGARPPARGPGPGPFLEVAGPREEQLADAARRLLARRREALRIEVVDDPADPDSALYAGGAFIPGPGAVRAGPTFDEWLDSAA